VTAPREPADQGTGIEPTRESILAALDSSKKPLTVYRISEAIGWHTNTPWIVVSLVHDLARDGLVAWVSQRPGSHWRAEITDAGHAALRAAVPQQGEGEGSDG
jgi:DNA-binding PadR family transcriptional regulator